MDAPFLIPIKEQGGTLYTFQSSQEDITATFNNSTTKFRFSKFVALDIPKIVAPETPTQDSFVYDSIDFKNANYIHYDNIEGRFFWADGSNAERSPTNIDQNNRWAEFMQNYLFNAEAILLSDPEYDPSTKLNASERIFWKSLKELGALRFQEANTAEYNQDSQAAQQGELRFVEETPNWFDPITGQVRDSNANLYRPVVKYIGEIDVVNDVKNYQNAFSEIYINIPNQDGNSPYVLFRPRTTENVYEPGQGFVSGINNPFIQGRDGNESFSPPLNYEAFYDHELNIAQAGNDPLGNPSLEFRLYSGDLSDPNAVLPNPEEGSRWFQRGALPGEDDTDPASGYNIAATGPFAYYTDKTFTDAGNDLIEREWFAPSGISKRTRYLRSRLDGITVDFNVDNYTQAIERNLTNLPQLNAIPETSTFEFNTVLIYYDVYDVSNPDDFETNLYGVLFLKDPIPNGSFGYKFECLSKYKPTGVDAGRLNGNAYAFKVNIKFDATVEDTLIEVGVNDYNTFSMEIFFDSAIRLAESADNLQEAVLAINDLKQQVELVKGLVLDQNNNIDLINRIEAIEEQINIATNNLENQDTLVELIERNYQEVLNIYQNQTSVNVAYNLDVIQSGEGILADREDGNRVVIRNTQQEYSSVADARQLDVINGESAVDNTFVLGRFTNYAFHQFFDTLEADDNVYIFIDDETIQWSKGQVFRFNFNTPVDFQGKSIILLTDSTNRQLNAEPYDVVVGTVTPESTTPCFEVVCVNAETLQFQVITIKP